MKLVVVAVGRVRDAHYRALCDDYARRIARFGLAVALEEQGVRRSSTELAAWMEDKARFGPKEIRRVVGGPYGLDEATKDACKESLRLSEMTLPHELARLLLLEQLYRAWTIVRGSPYHHA